MGTAALMTAAEGWSAQLAGWGIPDEILAQAPVSPWSHDVATFSVDDTLDRDGMSARVAREVLPLHGGVVLDVGCGGGRSSAVLVPPAEALIGVDQSETMLTAYVAAARSAGVAAQTRARAMARCRRRDPDRRCGRVPPRVLQRRRRRPVRDCADRARPAGGRGRDPRAASVGGLERGVEALLGPRPSDGSDRCRSRRRAA